MEIITVHTSTGDVLKKYRSQTHLTQAQLAEEMGVTKNTYYNWENDKASPSIHQLRYLCKKFGIPAHEILGLPAPDNLLEDEDRLLEVYRVLTPSGKRLATRLLSQVRENEEEESIKAIASVSFKNIGLSEWVWAAGVGCGKPDSAFYSDSTLVRKNHVNEKADIIIRISGDSMEPTFHNGDSVYVREISYVPDPDSVVIAIYDGSECIIKRVGSDRMLHSDNPALPFPPMYPDNNVKIMGQVLGKVHEEDFFSKEELSLLTEENQEEIRAFRKLHNISD